MVSKSMPVSHCVGVGSTCALPKGTGLMGQARAPHTVEPRCGPREPDPSRPGHVFAGFVADGKSRPSRTNALKGGVPMGTGLEGQARATPFTQHGLADGKSRPSAHTPDQPCQQLSQKNGYSIGGWEGGKRLTRRHLVQTGARESDCKCQRVSHSGR